MDGPVVQALQRGSDGDGLSEAPVRKHATVYGPLITQILGCFNVLRV